MNKEWELETGLIGQVTVEVDEQRTARWLGSGDVDVLATPAVLALAEAAACAAVAGRLPRGRTSVGTWAELEHLAATPVGLAVSASATLLAVDGRTLEFSLEVSDPGGVVARGRHRRAIIDRARFLQAASERGSPDGP